MSWEQQSIFDLAEAEAARDDALDRVEEHADGRWMDQAYLALCRVAMRQMELTADDVWALVPPPREPRAMGAVFRRAVADAVVRPTERYRPSARRLRHAAPLRVWASLVCTEVWS